MTQIILCDQVTLALEHRSLLQEVTGSGGAWLSFLYTGALSGLLLDGIAQWLGKLWIYPYWGEALYGSTFVIGFCAYWLAIVESYLAVKAIFSRRYAPVPSTKPPRYQVVLFRAIGCAGLMLASIGILELLREYRKIGGYVFEIRRPIVVKNHFSYFLIAFSGIWLVLEWAQFALGRLSLLKTILDERRLPLCALLVFPPLSRDYFGKQLMPPTISGFTQTGRCHIGES